MKRLLWIPAILILATRLLAQSNAPVRLALIAETPEASTAADVLTAQLSGNPQIQLLERNEIEKVYREQGLSAANKDYLKLGQVLSADGLLILSAAANDTNQSSPAIPAAFGAMSGGKVENQRMALDVRLIAVKPGVVLEAIRSVWSHQDSPDWARGVSQMFAADFPKLRVLARDAIPISVVNLRSAVQSTETQETERQLKQLTIQRLSRERQLFVLERQRMQQLAGEKELNADETAFWNGSYLLEGVLDQKGYSREVITINARLTPPKGGSPLLIEASGSRTNLAAVVNQLVAEVAKHLNVTSAIKDWDAADEAQQYLDEARWALRWEIYPEAQAAAESAWALGKHDLESASLRIRAYVDEIPAVIPPGFDHYVRGRKANYVHLDEPPDPKTLDRTLYVLELYRAFSRASPDGEPKVLSRDPGLGEWRISDWYQLGLQTLTAASQILQHFYFHPEAQTPVANKLSELRARSRSVAELISKSPSVHDGYFAGEPGYAMPPTNIFGCEVNYGCFWQERPEDAIGLYRELMSSPAFGFLEGGLWFRQPQAPRLVDWNENDPERLPAPWRKFMAELEASTNLFLRMQPMAIAVVEAKNDGELETAHRRLFSYVIANYEAIVTQNPALLAVPWTPGQFFGGGGRVVPIHKQLDQQFKEEYAPKLAALHDEFARRREAARQEQENRRSFEEQKRYLAAMTPYDFQQLIKEFGFHDYSREQAAELKPLLAAYRSNLLTQVPANDRFKSFQAQADAQAVQFHVERRVDELLNAPSPTGAPKAVLIVPPPAAAKIVAATTVVATNQVAVPKTEALANTLFARRYHAIPRDQLPATNLSNIAILNHRADDSALLLDLRYVDSWWERGAGFTQQRTVYREAAAILRPEGSWEVIPYPHSEDSPAGAGDFFLAAIGGAAPKSYSELLNGALYVSDLDAIRKYNFQTRQWAELPFPRQERPQLFAVNGRLYAANAETLAEINSDESGFRILAGTRRRPAASALDALPDLGAPVLFSGPDHSLCACIRDKTVRWDGNDWREQFALNGFHVVEPFPDAVIFRSSPAAGLAGLWLWKQDQSAPELCLAEEERQASNIGPAPFRPTPDLRAIKPRWQSPEGCHLTACTVACFKSRLFFLVRGTTAAGNDELAKLVCLDPDFAAPAVVPLKFDAPPAAPPAAGRPKPPARHFGGARSMWMRFIGNALYLGQAEVPGVWVVPLSEVEAAVATQRQIQAVAASSAPADSSTVRPSIGEPRPTGAELPTERWKAGFHEPRP